MTRKVFASLLMACLPWLAMAQSNNDLYFIPTKQKKVEKKEVKAEVHVSENQTAKAAAYTVPVSNVVIKDVKGNVRDIDEYNRRYTSRDNNFKVDGETLYVEEKPYGERGEWVNGFEGSQMDYENAMRIVRFHNPRFAIPVSSPLYWDVVYGVYPSWEWNVFDDGMYAYVFPTYSNRLYWDFNFYSGWYGPGWGWNSYWYNRWHRPYWHYPYYSGWYGRGWYDSYYCHHRRPCYYDPYYHHYYGHVSHRPSYRYNDRRSEYGRPSDHLHSRPSYSNHSSDRNSSNRVVVDSHGRTGGRVSSSGRVVSGSRGSVSSVRGHSYVGTSGNHSGSSLNRNSYTRPSRTEKNSSYHSNNGSYRNSGAFNRMNNRNSSRSNHNHSYNSSRSSQNRSYSSSNRSSYGSSVSRSSSHTSHSGSTTVGRSGGGARRR